MRCAWFFLMIGCAPAAPAQDAPLITLESASAPTATTLPEPPPAPVRRQRSLSVGSYGRCLVTEGKLRCWGRMNGQAATAPISSLDAVAIPEPVVEASVGEDHACAATKMGHVYCWGRNDWGQLGIASAALEVAATAPARVVDIDDAISVEVATRHSCGLLRSGHVSCWGSNLAGQGGHDTAYTTQAHRLVRPVAVPEVAGANLVAVDERSSCALDGQRVQCWGNLHHMATSESHAAPSIVDVEWLTGATNIDIEADYGCALVKERVRCFGYPWSGRLGHDEREPHVAVTDLRDAIDISVGSAHACALRSSGSVACWGSNANGQLGTPGLRSTPTPRNVIGVSRATEVALGRSTSCARSDDVLWCWGNAPFQDGQPDQPEARPVRLR